MFDKEAFQQEILDEEERTHLILGNDNGRPEPKARNSGDYDNETVSRFMRSYTFYQRLRSMAIGHEAQATKALTELEESRKISEFTRDRVLNALFPVTWDDKEEIREN